MDVIGLDEKDIDKALIDGNGMPVRAPRDMKAGDSFWVYMGPAQPITCPECTKRREAERDMAKAMRGMIVLPTKIG